MYDPVESIQIKEPVQFQRGKTIEGLIEKPKEKPIEEKEPDLIDELNHEWREIESERRSEFARALRERNKKLNKQRTKVPKVKKYEFSEDALERMEQRKHNRAVERQGTLTPRQTDVLTDLSNGLRWDLIAAKQKITIGAVGDHLYNARLRLCAYTNAHAVRIALERKLI